MAVWLGESRAYQARGLVLLIFLWFEITEKDGLFIISDSGRPGPMRERRTRDEGSYGVWRRPPKSDSWVMSRSEAQFVESKSAPSTTAKSKKQTGASGAMDRDCALRVDKSSVFLRAESEYSLRLSTPRGIRLRRG